MSVNDFFTSTITVQRAVNVPDGLGGYTTGWTAHLVTPGLVRPLRGSEKLVGGKLAARSTHRMYCPVIDITADDRVVFDGATYGVTFVDNPMNMDMFLQVGLERIT